MFNLDKFVEGEPATTREGLVATFVAFVADPVKGTQMTVNVEGNGQVLLVD